MYPRTTQFNWIVAQESIARGCYQHSLCTVAGRRTFQAVRRLSMATKGTYRRASTSLYLIESREAERKLTEARNKKKALAAKPPKSR